MAFRSLLVVGVLGVVTMGCTSSYVVVPATGGRVAAASVAGVSMAAFPESWNRDPVELPEYLTPIWLNIVNQSSQTVRLRYGDFALMDASGFRYAAISPYSGQPQAAPNPAPSAAPVQPATPSPPALQPSVPPAPSPTESEPGSTTETGATDVTSTWSDVPHNATGAKIILISAGRGGRGGAGMRGGGGFRGHGGGVHRGFYGHPHVGAHVYVGPGPFFYDPWWPYAWGPYPYHWGVYHHGPYVYSWDYGYYPGAPTADILQFGLPEGELQPGGRVSGFVYFQHAVRQPGRLDLTWDVRSTDGRSIASVTAPMLVVED